MVDTVVSPGRRARVARETSAYCAIGSEVDLPFLSIQHSPAIEAYRHSLQGRYSALSRREKQVFALVNSGLMNKQIAGALDISEVTVKAHRGRVMQKMSAASLPDLVRMALALEIYPLRPTVTARR